VRCPKSTVCSSSGYWVNVRSVALDFSPPPTDPLALIDLLLLPAGLTFTTDPTPLLSVHFPCGLLSFSPCSYIAGYLRLVAQSAATCSRWFPAREFLYPEDGAIRSSETSVNARSTQRHIPEDGILHSHRCENLKSYIDV
jgi:hypothetical protein